MRLLTIAFLVAGLCVMTGCKSTADCANCAKNTGAVAADGDMCAKCPGVQLAGTDVKCEKCGMMLKK